jgi:ion channel-forming bestrophin family protein
VPPLHVIVRPRPHWIRLLFVRRGSLVHRIYGQQLLIFALSCAVVWAHGQLFLFKVTLNASPFSLMGVALAIFLGFRINASYDRYWEARKHWGAILVETRNLARQSLTLMTAEQSVRPFVLGLVGFATTLRNQLRGLPQANQTEALLPDALREQIGNARSAPTLVLVWLGRWLQERRAAGELNPTLSLKMEGSLDNLSMAQGSCERIANTPLPFTYSVILHRSAYMYCALLPFGLVDSIGLMTPLVVTFVSYTFFALEALSDEIEEPFGILGNDLALNAMVAGIDANLREMLGETPPPAPMPDKNFILD